VSKLWKAKDVSFFETRCYIVVV